MRFEFRDIFYGDKLKHQAANKKLGQGFFTPMLLSLAENCHILSNSQLVEGINLVIMISGISSQPYDVLLHKLDNDPDFRDSVRDWFGNKDYTPIRNLASLHEDAVAEDSQSDLNAEQTEATEKAWRQPYVGQAHACLYEAMEAYRLSWRAYGRFLPIVQSSGTGKSRMVGELSKEHLVIPINLRPERERGFLAPDRNARHFLNMGTSKWEVYTRYEAFFTALFQQLLTHLQAIGSDPANDNKTNRKNYIAAKFRFLMTQNQTYHAPNEYREMFYQQVCRKAVNLFEFELARLNQQKDEPMIKSSVWRII